MKEFQLWLVSRGVRVTGAPAQNTNCLCPKFGCVQKCNFRAWEWMAFSIVGSCDDYDNDSLSCLT